MAVQETERERDVFREIPLRYLGYANELGEAFRHMVPVRLVHLSYAVSSGYVLSHAVSQCWSAHRTHMLTLEKSPAHHYHHKTPTHSSASKTVSPGVAFMDTLLWQGLASVLIPGLVINRVCAGSRILLNTKARHLLSRNARKWIVTGVGIGTIPVIIHPIDSAVDKLMDSVVRPVCLRLTT